MPQVTLVACYGEKPPALTRLLDQCQQLVTRTLGVNFEPYALPQIHATIIGLERMPGLGLDNRNFQVHRQRKAPMDFDGFLACLRNCQHWPFQVQIGGFEANQCPFRSRGERPYFRSFTLQKDKVVLMGWPVPKERPGRTLTTHKPARQSLFYPTTLDEVRRAAQAFNILHAYHASPADVDNDFYFRIGTIRHPDGVSAADRDRLLYEVREFLRAESPVMIELTLRDLHLVRYEHDTLPLDSTYAFKVADPGATGDRMAALYR